MWTNACANTSSTWSWQRVIRVASSVATWWALWKWALLRVLLLALLRLAVAMEVLRHRVILSYEAEAEEVTAETVVQKILDSVEVP